jgi:hypothetical protein
MNIKARWGALALAGLLAVSACGGSYVKSPAKNAAATVVQSAAPSILADVAMARPGSYSHHPHSADILIQSRTTLPTNVLNRVRATTGATAAVQFSMATFYSEENAVTYAAVNPATFRAFTYGSTAALDEVWDRVADGEIALRSDLKSSLALPSDYIALGNDNNAKQAHIGAYAPLVDRSKIGAVLNERWAAKLGMPQDNAMFVSTGNSDPAPVLSKLRKAFGKSFSVSLLAPNVDPNDAQTAVLTGGSVSQAVGSFTYTANADGTVNPQTSWVAKYIVTEQVPIIGSVRCNKVMLPQLRMALQHVIRAGLASKIHPSEYGGCYVPRYIANDPAKGLSFHTFGTAIDLNVPGNERGTIGQMDRNVVAIFQGCGFNWGGLWHYTDPMHFELARLVASC